MLTRQPAHASVSVAVRPYIDWGNSKRLLASVWVWVRITHGDTFADTLATIVDDAGEIPW